MAYNLLRCERDQSYLMPPSMRDWLSEGHLAWFIVDAVGQMDLTSRSTAAFIIHLAVALAWLGRACGKPWN